MDKFIIARQKFQGENKVSTDYVSVTPNGFPIASTDPLAFDTYFGTKEQAHAFKASYQKHLQATTNEEGVSYKVRVKAASQALRDFCTESIHRLEEKATVTDEAQAAVLESIKVVEPEQVEQPVEGTVEKPKKQKKAKQAEPEQTEEQPAAETEQAAA